MSMSRGRRVVVCSSTALEQVLLVVAGLALVYPRPLFDAIGVGLCALVLVLQYARRAAPARLPA